MFSDANFGRTISITIGQVIKKKKILLILSFSYNYLETFQFIHNREATIFWTNAIYISWFSSMKRIFNFEWSIQVVQV